MITTYTVENHEHLSDKPYEEVVAAFEEAVADAEHGELNAALAAAADAEAWEKSLTAMFGPSGFIRVFSLDHGRWLSFYGQPRKATKYVYGNPIVAETMLRHDVRAGLQVPLSILIHDGDDGRTRISFDLPSSVLRFLDVPALAEAATALDAKLIAFVEGLTA